MDRRRLILKGESMFKILSQAIRQTLIWSILCGRGLSGHHDASLFQVVFHRPGQRQPGGARTARSSAPPCWRSNLRARNYFWPRPSACTYGTSAFGPCRLQRQQSRPDQRRVANQRRPTIPPPSARPTTWPPTRRCPWTCSTPPPADWTRTSARRPRACKSPASPPPAA